MSSGLFLGSLATRKKTLSFWDPEKRRLSGSNLDLCCVRLIFCTDFTKVNHHPSPPMCRIRFVFTSKSKQQRNVQRFICFHRPWRETSRTKFFPEQKKTPLKNREPYMVPLHFSMFLYDSPNGFSRKSCFWSHEGHWSAASRHWSFASFRCHSAVCVWRSGALEKRKRVVGWLVGWLVGLGWVGLGWVGLGWVGLGWVGLVGWLVGCWVGLAGLICSKVVFLLVSLVGWFKGCHFRKKGQNKNSGFGFLKG